MSDCLSQVSDCLLQVSDCLSQVTECLSQVNDCLSQVSGCLSQVTLHACPHFVCDPRQPRVKWSRILPDLRSAPAPPHFHSEIQHFLSDIWHLISEIWLFVNESVFRCIKCTKIDFGWQFRLGSPREDYRSWFLANVNSRLRSIYTNARLSVVYRLSVTLVHPTHPVEIFRNVSSPFGTLATRLFTENFMKIVPWEPIYGWRVKRKRGSQI